MDHRSTHQGYRNSEILLSAGKDLAKDIDMRFGQDAFNSPEYWFLAVDGSSASMATAVSLHLKHTRIFTTSKYFPPDILTGEGLSRMRGYLEYPNTKILFVDDYYCDGRALSYAKDLIDHLIPDGYLDYYGIIKAGSCLDPNQYPFHTTVLTD
jgi:hypothetical protein